MSTEIKFKMAVGFLILCVIGLIMQGIALWRIDQRQAGATEYSDIPQSIMERLESRLDAQNQQVVSPVFNRDPFARMQQMQRQMDSLFNSFSPFGSNFSGPTSGAFQSFSLNSQMPSLQLLETPEEYQVVLQTPEEHELVLNTELEDNLLTLSGTLKKMHSSNSRGFASSFVSSSQFSRSFDLNKPVNELGMVTEQTEDGLLVRVPKTS